jgi:hypothetical protein
MPNITVTNISSSTIFLSDLYATLHAGQSVTAYRPQSSLSAMTGLIAAKSAGQVSVVIANTADEESVGLEHLVAPDSLTLDPTKPFSILSNTTGGQANFTLPDGKDGLVKEVFVFFDTTNPIFLQITTGVLNNDGIDMNGPTAYAKMIWNTALGGWVTILMSGGATFD